ncbi:MAG: DUF2314 domain-containing protein [Aureliella sp.]
MAESGISYFPGDDPEMAAASKLARQTFRFFWREASWERRRIIPAYYMMAVKGAFSDPPEVRAENPNGLEVEHMWVSDVNFDGSKITGTLLNNPGSLKSLSEGDPVTLAPKQVSDWMYADDVAYGAFTVQLLRSRMSSAERKQHDAAWGLEFGDHDIIHVVPPEHLGDKPAKPKKFLGLFGKSATKQPQDYKAAALVEHPMSVAMSESLKEQLQQNPSFLTDADEDGFTFLHSLSMAGSYDCVKVLLEAGADVNTLTRNGKTAYALAKILGWGKVMKLLQSAGAQA